MAVTIGPIPLIFLPNSVHQICDCAARRKARLSSSGKSAQDVTSFGSSFMGSLSSAVAGVGLVHFAAQRAGNPCLLRISARLVAL